MHRVLLGGSAPHDGDLPLGTNFVLAHLRYLIEIKGWVVEVALLSRRFAHLVKARDHNSLWCVALPLYFDAVDGFIQQNIIQALDWLRFLN